MLQRSLNISHRISRNFLILRRCAASTSASNDSSLCFPTNIFQTTPKEKDKLLRGDVKDLGKLLGDCIREYDPHVFDSVEKLRNLGKKVSNFFIYLIVPLVCGILISGEQAMHVIGKLFKKWLIMSNRMILKPYLVLQDHFLIFLL
jgi:hypothetical protein